MNLAPDASAFQGLDHLIDVGVVSGEVLVVLVEDLVARGHHDRRTELEGAPTGVLLSMATSKRSESCGNGPESQDGRRPKRSRTDDLRGDAILVEENRKGHALVLDEGLGIPLATRADGRDLGTGRKDLVISIADLTGPLTTGQSTEVAEEQDDLWMLPPSIPEPVCRAFRIDQQVVGE